MKRFFAVLTALVLLCACSTRRTVENTKPESESTTENSIESLPESSFEVSEESNGRSPDAEEVPHGYREIYFGEFSVLVSDDSFSRCAPMEIVTMENNQFIGDDSENNRVIAELLSVDDVADKNELFAPYDEKYFSAIDTVELLFNGFDAKKYHVQTQADEALSVLSNNIFYCICLDDKIITFAYYPVMGHGGMHTEDIETVLNTIRLK